MTTEHGSSRRSKNVSGKKIEPPADYFYITLMSVDIVESIKSCFGEGSVQDVRIEDHKIFIAITEDDNWWRNKCVMYDWYFDYEKFKTLNMHIDCVSYGVYVFWPKIDLEEFICQACGVPESEECKLDCAYQAMRNAEEAESKD